MDSSRTANAACKALRSSGLSAQETYPILNCIKKWVESSGEEWTIKRLKSLKQAYIFQLAGQPDLAKLAVSWVASDSKGTPKGAFSVIFNKLGRKPQKALSALMVYSVFLSKELTTSQKKKFYTAVTTTDPSDQDVYCCMTSMEELGKRPQVDRYISVADSLTNEKRVPFPTEIRENKISADPQRQFLYKNGDRGERVDALISVERTYDNIRESAGNDIALDYMNSQPDIPNDIYKLISSSVMDGCDVSFVGSIGHIQEPGYKLRSVANVLPIFQILASSMSYRLYGMLKDIPEDATFDQDRAILEIQSEMTETPLVAIDLSNATDTFPRNYTYKLLKDLNVRDIDLLLFKSVSEGTWFDKHSPTGLTTKWNGGQPLGFLPSFAAFALSHHNLARQAIRDMSSAEAYENFDNPSYEFKRPFFRILGDDIVVEKRLAPFLMDLYERLNLTVSHDKTMDSELLTEFGGRIITPTGVYVQPKWRDLSDRSFLDLARRLGPQALGMLKPRQKRVVKLFSEIPRDLHPFGLGWNPLGKPYSQRVEESQAVLDLVKDSFEIRSNETVRSFSDLEVNLRYRNSVPEFRIEDDPLECEPQLAVTYENALLDNLSIGRVEVAIDNVLDWKVDYQHISDPRGTTLLSQIEKRYGDLLCTPEDSSEPTLHP